MRKRQESLANSLQLEILCFNSFFVFLAISSLPKMNSKSFHLCVMYLSMRINPNNQFYGDVRVYYSLKYALLLDAVWCMTEALNKEEIGLSV